MRNLFFCNNGSPYYTKEYADSSKIEVWPENIKITGLKDSYTLENKVTLKIIKAASPDLLNQLKLTAIIKTKTKSYTGTQIALYQENSNLILLVNYKFGKEPIRKPVLIVTIDRSAGNSEKLLSDTVIFKPKWYRFDKTACR